MGAADIAVAFWAPIWASVSSVDRGELGRLNTMRHVSPGTVPGTESVLVHQAETVVWQRRYVRCKM